MGEINSKTDPFVSIVVATYNRESYIINCIKSLLIQSYTPEKREIIVVIDPKTTDRTKELLSKYPVTILMASQGGPASCRNEGVEIAKGEVVAFIDDDSVADEYWLENLISNFSDPEIVGVGGIYPDPNEGVFHEYYRIDGGLGNLPVQGKIIVSRENYMTFPTCNVCYLKKVFLEVGGFDPQLIRGQDRELLWRIIKKGYKLVYDSSAIAYHYGVPSTLRTLIRKTYLMGRYRVQFYRKHPDFFQYVKGHRTVKRTLAKFFSFLFLLAFIFVFFPLPYVVAILCFGYLGLIIRYSLLKPKGGLKHAVFFPLLKLASYLAWNLGVIKGSLRHG